MRRAYLLVIVCLSLGGCTSLSDYVHNGFKVGPKYETPDAPTAAQWIDANDKRQDIGDLSQWWKVFDDPILDDLIESAYKQNLTLREAGYRILQARAQLGIAIGEFFPQSQNVTGNFTTTAVSGLTVFGPFQPQKSFGQWNVPGFNLAWEMDFWGRYRRAIESADASLEASVFDYDDALVTLLSDVATAYVNMRVVEQRIKYAQKNVELQKRTWKIADARVKVDNDGGLTVDQAITLLKQTEATIPQFEITLRITTNQLCILLGIPPEDLQKKFADGRYKIDSARPLIPTAPKEVAAGVPADLLRRRPDVRRAERQAAAQSALIGVAEADYYPRISIGGNLGYSADQFRSLFSVAAFNGNFGPSFQWQVLQYGRILNNVRLQKAKYEELVTAYQQTVLTGQQEAENGLITFLKAQEFTRLQAESADHAEKGEKNVTARFLIGAENMTRVTQLQQLLVQEQDLLAQAQGEIALGLITVYKALGGGWQIRRSVDAIAMPPPRIGTSADDDERRRHPIAKFGPPQ